MLLLRKRHKNSFTTALANDRVTNGKTLEKLFKKEFGLQLTTKELLPFFKILK